MSNNQENLYVDVSSSEITAAYRCVYPNLSQDNLSKHLVSPAGKERAKAFIKKYNYPLAPLKISLCAAYFFRETTRMLRSKHYDSCISFASGFSLLVYLIAKKCQNLRNIKYFDTDLPHLLEERNARIDKIKTHLLQENILKRICAKAFDIEQAYQNKAKLKEIFTDCECPIFILDGILYFLSPGCVEWLLDEINTYSKSAIAAYYWPTNMLERSTLFAKVYSDLNQGMILEEIKSFWDTNTLKLFTDKFTKNTDIALEEFESQLVPDNERQLTDPNEFFPIRLITGEK